MCKQSRDLKHIEYMHSTAQLRYGHTYFDFFFNLALSGLQWMLLIKIIVTHQKIFVRSCVVASQFFITNQNSPQNQSQKIYELRNLVQLILPCHCHPCLSHGSSCLALASSLLPDHQNSAIKRYSVNISHTWAAYMYYKKIMFIITINQINEWGILIESA